VFCYKGTYSIELGNQRCSSCEDSLHCYGGSDIVPYEGFWRLDNTSTTLYSCLSKQACLNNGTDECTEGYKGYLCSQCMGLDKQTDKYFAKVGFYSCEECGAMWKEVIIVVCFLLIFIGYILLMTYLIIRNPNREKEDSVQIRILTNYYQDILFIKELSLNWPESIKRFLQAFSFLVSSSSSLLKINCLLMNIEGAEENSYALSLAFFALSPFMFAIFSGAIAFLISLRKTKSTSTIWEKYISLNFVFIFAMLPTISSYAFGMFNCMEVEGA